MTASLTYRAARLWLLVRAVRLSTWALERIYAAEIDEAERRR